MSIALPSSLTLPNATAALAQLRQSIGGHREAIVIEAGALTQLDSSAIAVLLQCRREALAQGLSLRLNNPPAKLLDLMRLYGVAELFNDR